MVIVDKMRVIESYPAITLATAHFWNDQDRQKSGGRKSFWLLAIALHLALAVLFVIELKTPVAVHDDMAIELVAPPAPAQAKPEEPKPEIKETPKPKPLQQRAIPKPAPHIDPPHPAAIAVAPEPPPPPQAAAPSPPAAPTAQQSAPPPTYLAELYAHLGRYKHYPRAAQLAHVEGTAYLRFTMNRQGKVLSYKIERVSGHAELDAEVLAMIERAQPLPIPPANAWADMQNEIELVIPVQFSVR